MDRVYSIISLLTMNINRPGLTLYPTAGRLSYAINRLVEGGGDAATLVPGMMTIGQFETKLQAGILGARKKISGFGRSMLMTRVIEKFYQNNTGGVFRPIHTFPGFLASILSFFDELGAGLVAPELLPGIKGYAPEKEKEIAKLYSAYSEELAKRGLYDSGTLRRDLVEALSKAQWKLPPALIRFGSIRLVDIYQFTPYRFELFRNLAKRTPVTIVSPTPDNRRRAFGFTVSNLAKFEALGDQAGKLEIEFSVPGGGSLAPLKERIFDLSPSGAGSEQACAPAKILSCSSRYREIEEVGASIFRMVKQDGRRWSDFAVVFRDIRPYGAIVDDVFNRYSIPFYFKRGLSLGQNPLIRAALCLFGAINSGYARDDIARIIGSPYFGRFIDTDTDAAQTLFIEAGIIEGAPSEWRRRLKKRVAGYKGGLRDKANRIANLTGELLDKLARLKRQNRPPQFLDHLTRLFTWLKLSPESGYSGPKSDIIRFRDNNAYMQLIETVNDAGQAVEKMKMGSSPLGFEVIKDLLTGEINKRTAPEPGAADLNRVQALNIHDVVGLDFSHLFICGLHEGEFPLRAQARSILTQQELEAFNKTHAQTLGDAYTVTRKGRRVFDRASDKWQEESLLFFQAIRAAGETVHFTYSLQELDGTPIMRSLFIDDVLDVLAPGASLEDRENVVEHTSHLAIAKDASLLPDPEEQKAKLLRDLFRGSKDDNKNLEPRIGQIARGAPGWKRFRTLLSLAATERERDSFFIEPDVEKKNKLATVYNGGLSSCKERINDILVVKRQGRYSPTALESFGQCPFRYFAGRLLGLEAVEEPALEMDARGSGTLWHAVLEKFYEKMIKQKRLPLKGGDDERKTLLDTALKEFEKSRKNGLLGEMAIWEAEEEKTLAALARWLDGEVDDQTRNRFIPVGVEVIFDFKRFEKTSDHEPYLISMPCGGDRYLTGRVDRIDVSASDGRLRVVDYKSGANVAKYKKMVGKDYLGKLSFQPGIYMLLAREWALDRKILGKAGSMSGGYRLIHMDEAGKAYVMTDSGKEIEIDDGEFIGTGPGAEERPGTFERQAGETIEKIESGLFYASPVNCDYCDYPGLCRFIAMAKESAGEG